MPSVPIEIPSLTVMVPKSWGWRRQPARHFGPPGELVEARVARGDVLRARDADVGLPNGVAAPARSMARLGRAGPSVIRLPRSFWHAGRIRGRWDG
jgi:hypothetical protein